ncbi:MAG TPA: 30S ribosomal protein S6 [Longimicrobiales bacterium]|nr:30S ribosomal protein S6 [Longimicrobiales bacterium]
MRLYEFVYIFDSALDEAGIDEKLERFHDIATEGAGEVTAVDHWGSRQLAYPIGGHATGYYVVAHVQAEPGNLPEFERILKLDDDLLRNLIVLNEGEPTSGMSIVSPRPPSESEEEDEEEEDDEEEEEEDDDSPPEFGGGRGRRRRHEGPAIELLNYKDVATLSKFITEQGKILPKRTTKVSARFQRQLSQAVKRARYLALVPYTRDHEG